MYLRKYNTIFFKLTGGTMIDNSSEEKKKTEKEILVYAETFAEIDFEEMKDLLDASIEFLAKTHNDEEKIS